MDSLERRPRKPKEIVSLLEPPGLSSVYKRIIKTGLESQKDHQKHLTRHALTLIYHAAKPMTIDELRSALANVFEKTSPPRKSLPDGDEVVNACGGFVEIDSGTNTVRLVHSLMRQYLEIKAPFLVKERPTTEALRREFALLTKYKSFCGSNLIINRSGTSEWILSVAPEPCLSKCNKGFQLQDLCVVRVKSSVSCIRGLLYIVAESIFHSQQRRVLAFDSPEGNWMQILCQRICHDSFRLMGVSQGKGLKDRWLKNATEEQA